jgi:iron-sulfur cluster assembly protein
MLEVIEARERPRERPPIMTISAAAVARIKALLAKREVESDAIRISVRSGGCSGLSYEIEFAKDPEAGDETIERDGVRVFIDGRSVMFLVGTEMDYVEEMLQSGFRFRNPNERGRCGCGESFHV